MACDRVTGAMTGFLDPGRPVVAAGLKRCRDAGIVPFTVMLCDNIPRHRWAGAAF